MIECLRVRMIYQLGLEKKASIIKLDRILPIEFSQWRVQHLGGEALVLHLVF
jgi:hypothetical protein